MKKIKMSLATLAVVTTPLVAVVACSNEKSDTHSKATNPSKNIPKQDEKFVEVPYTVHTTYELINFDMLRDADEKARMEADAEPGKHFISSTNIQTKGSHGDLLMKKVLNDENNTFYIDLLDRNDNSHLSKKPIKLNKDELMSLSKFITKILLENPQKQKTKRYLPIDIKHGRKELIDVLNKNQKGREYWNNVYVDTPKNVDISEAKKHPITINNFGYILVKKDIAKWRWNLLLGNLIDSNDIGSWDKRQKEILDEKNTWFVLNPDYPTRLNKSGKVLKTPIGLTRYEFEVFSSFWTEFYSAPVWNMEVKMVLPIELTRHREELIGMLNNMRDYNHKNLIVVDHK